MEDILAGGFSAIFSRTVTAPLELFKLQRQNSFMPYSTIHHVLKREGLTYLWKGNGTNCIRAFPQFGLSFAIFQETKKNVPIDHPALSNFVAGNIAGATAIACIYPLETARSRLSLQSCHSHYSSLSDALRKMSIKEMYGGAKMSMLGFGAYNAFAMMFYYNFMDSMQNKLIAGGLSGLLTTTCVYPTDLIRRRLQLQGFDPSVPKASGITDCVKKIIQKESFKGLYRGLLASYLKVIPTTAIQFWALGTCKDIFSKEK